MFLVDTCALSEFTKPRPAATVERWFAATDDTSQFLSVLTLGELEKGVQKLAPGRRRERLEAWLAELEAEYAPRTLDVGAAVAREWGRLSARTEVAGVALPASDALIGATALVHGLTVVTRNTSHIGRTGARIVDPWTQGT